jgi:hypothetical protein
MRACLAVSTRLRSTMLLLQPTCKSSQHTLGGPSSTRSMSSIYPAFVFCDAHTVTIIIIRRLPEENPQQPSTRALAASTILEACQRDAVTAHGSAKHAHFGYRRHNVASVSALPRYRSVIQPTMGIVAAQRDLPCARHYCMSIRSDCSSPCGRTNPLGQK